MGILNVTPDSFSDGGRFTRTDTTVSSSCALTGTTDIDTDSLLKTCEQMVSDGVDIIDIGGESTRPDAPRVSAEEELSRVLPAIEAVSSHFDIPISIDTYKAEVALKAAEIGAVLINDVWGLRADDAMAGAVASIMHDNPDTALCIMHNRRPVGYESGIPITMHGETIDYGYSDDFMTDVCADLLHSIRLATNSGIPTDRIILDPGVGFAKTYEQNLTVMRNMNRLRYIDISDHIADIHMDPDAHCYPILLGCSRKSVIGMTLDKKVDDRLYGTLATTAYGVMQGADFIRVHDIGPNADVIRMIRAIMGRER